MNYHIFTPVTKEDFEKYFQLRWEVLRQPWNQLKGSERDDTDDRSIHLMAVDENNFAVGVCRIHFNGVVAQIRYMAVHRESQGKGIGKMLLKQAEDIARQNGMHSIFLQARQTAIDFYTSQGYALIEKTHLLFDEIQHYSMEKKLF